MKRKRWRVVQPPSPSVQFDDTKFYSAKQLHQILRVHIVTVWRWVRLGVLPAPQKIGPNTTRWSGAALNRHFANADAGTNA
jgi:predicted DNA-binding transcriptional regulator AlpA